MSDQRTLTHAQWLIQATALFGPDQTTWRFVCPICKVETCMQQWLEAGAPEGAIAFSCIGRYTGGTGTMMQEVPHQPCDYTGGELFRLNPVTVVFPDGKTRETFEFAAVNTVEAAS